MMATERPTRYFMRARARSVSLEMFYVVTENLIKASMVPQCIPDEKKSLTRGSLRTGDLPGQSVISYEDNGETAC